MKQIMVTISSALGNCIVWLLGYQCIANIIIINCLIVFDGMNDFVMLFHWMYRCLGFSEFGISLRV